MVCNIYEGRRMTTSDLAMVMMMSLLKCTVRKILWRAVLFKRTKQTHSRYILCTYTLALQVSSQQDIKPPITQASSPSSATSPQMHPMIIMRLVTFCLPISLHFIPILLPRKTALSLSCPDLSLRRQISTIAFPDQLQCKGIISSVFPYVVINYQYLCPLQLQNKNKKTLLYLPNYLKGFASTCLSLYTLV